MRPARVAWWDEGFRATSINAYAVDDTSPEPALGMLPEVDARALLSRHRLRLRMLRPPYPAIGIGALRALRVVERDGATEIVAGYDGYERLGRPERAGER